MAEELKLLVNLGKEVQAFRSFKEFQQLMEEAVTLARQAEGWRRNQSGASKDKLATVRVGLGRHPNPHSPGDPGR